MNFPKRYVVTSFKWLDFAKSKLKNRIIEASVYCPENKLYYLDKKNNFKVVDMTSGSIFKKNLDEYGFPSVYLKITRGKKKMTNLRDWQKKASERRDLAWEKLRDSCSGGMAGPYDGNTLDYYSGWSDRDAEIGLLLQIIEKQSEALGMVDAVGMPEPYDKIVRTTQSEVEHLIEKLVKDE